MSFNFSQPLSRAEEFGRDFSKFDSEFDSELPGYEGDRARTVTNRPRQRFPSSNGLARARSIRGTLPAPYPSERIRNKYSIPSQKFAREEQFQQTVDGFKLKEKLESLEAKLTRKMAMFVEFAIQEMETLKPPVTGHEKQLELIRGLQQKLQPDQVTSNLYIDQKYKEMDNLDKLVNKYKSDITTKQEDIKQRVTNAMSEFKFNSEIEP